MQLVADVGNTETVVGIVADDAREVVAHWRLSTPIPRTEDEYAVLLSNLLAREGVDPEGVVRGVIGSVVPGRTPILTAAIQAVTHRSVVEVDAASPLPIRLEVEEPRTVGADRVVNTLAAKELFGRDTVVVDLGTATTYDCITADGAFLGGVISPGILVGLEWLGQRTAKLPRVDLQPPSTVVGKRTEACIRSGVFYSAVDAIDGIVRRILEEWNPDDPIVVATGGLGALIASHTRTIDRVEPHLTLQGLAMAGQYLSGACR